MTSPKQIKDETMHYVRMNWPILCALVLGAVLWGTTSQRIEALEKDADEKSGNSERIVRIETQITTVQASIGELKDTMKEEHVKFNEDVKQLEKTINDNFRELLLEVQRNRESD